MCRQMQQGSRRSTSPHAPKQHSLGRHRQNTLQRQGKLMNKIRILVVDDQTVVREGMVAILSLQPDMEVVGEAENGIEAVHLARKTKPDVILLDMVDRKSTRLNSSHGYISYAVFCLKKKIKNR